jgi:hypothetical protein
LKLPLREPIVADVSPAGGSEKNSPITTTRKTYVHGHEQRSLVVLGHDSLTMRTPLAIREIQIWKQQVAAILRKMNLYKAWRQLTVAILDLSDEKELIPVGVAPPDEHPQ